MWFGSLKNNSSKPLEFDCPKDPIKFFGKHLSYDQSENNNKNFFIKIKKMETKLNLWLSRDLTLFGRTLLVKSLGLSLLIYSSSMLLVPESVIQQTQTKLFSFLWKHKKDKIKRQVLFQPLSKGGLNFPCFRTAVKALRLGWIGRFLDLTKETWKVILNHYFDKIGGLSFILNCNYSAEKLSCSIPTFYREMLTFFQELHNDSKDPMQRDFILCNNKEITIENKSLFWRSWLDKKVVFIQDILDGNGNFIPFNKFKEKYNINTNFLQYYQIISAIPTWLRRKAAEANVVQSLFPFDNTKFQLSKEVFLDLTKMRCKQFYNLLLERSDISPTAIEKWRRKNRYVADNWENSLQTIYSIKQPVIIS